MTILATALLMGSTALMSDGGPLSVTVGPIITGLRPIALAPAPTGSKFIVCLEDGSVRIMDAKTRSTVRILAKHPDPAYAAAWSPDGTYVATGDERARIYIESPITGGKIREYRTHTKGIQKLSFNMTRQYLASTGKDDQINIYDLSKPSIREARHILGKGANFYGASFSPKLPYDISTGILGPGGRTYNSNSGQVTGFLTTEDQQGVFDVNFDGAGTHEVTAGRDGEAIVWDSKTRKKIGTLMGHKDWVVYAVYSPNGKFIATSSTDQTVKVWNAATLQKVADLPSQTSVGSPLCFTADGNTLVTVSDQGFLEFNNVSPSVKAIEAPAPAKAKAKKPRRRRHRGS
ncbi:MAG: hypothetical protein P4L46_10385 [Fimbriimonas sp.]|nr:hypothetical protein [Fimbriimonas sp.]